MGLTWRSPRLRRILKYFALGSLVVFILFGAVSWIVFAKKNEWLRGQIQSYLQTSQSGQMEISSIDLKLLGNFPDITLALGGVQYYEHPDSLRATGERPILRAEHLYVAVELLPLIQDELSVTEVSVSDAQFNIIEYENGQLNINRALAVPRKPKPAVAKKAPTQPKSPTPSEPKPKAKPVPAAPTPAMQVDLQFISLDNILVSWHSHNVADSVVVMVNDFDADFFSDEKAIDSKVASVFRIQHLQVGGLSIPEGDLKIESDVHYDREHQALNVKQGEIRYKKFRASIEGTYEHQKNRKLDLTLDASSNDLEVLAMIIKQEVLKGSADVLQRGDVYATGRVFGEVRHPQFDFSVGVRDVDLSLPNDMGKFQDVGFDGVFKSGEATDYSQAVMELKNIRGKLPGGFLRGAFHLENFVDPFLKYDLHAQLKLDGYDQVFNIDFLDHLKGTISLKARYDGRLNEFSSHQMDSSRSSSLVLDNISFGVASTKQVVSGLSGKVENKNNRATIDQLTFRYGRNDFQLQATIDNLVYLLFKDDREIVAVGNMKSNQLFTEDLLFDTTLTADVQDRISALNVDFQLKTVTRKIGGRVDTLDFVIQNLSAKLDQLPDLKKIDARGQFFKTNRGLELSLPEFHANLPQGKLDVVGDLLVQSQYRWSFNAKARATQFPWTYVKELVAEIKEGVEPTLKKLPVKQMELVTADLDLSAGMITYPFDFTRLDVRNSDISVKFPDSKILSVGSINVALDDLLFSHQENSGNLTGLKSTHGDIELKQLKVPGLNPFDVTMDVDGERDTLDIRFSSKTQKAKSETGTLFVDISKKDIGIRLQYHVQDVRLEYFINKYYKKNFMEGSIDYDLDLHARGETLADARKKIAGTIEISGDSLLLHGIDIDNVLKKFEKSQNFNLTDVGAVLIAGPVGLAVTKGSDFVSLAAVRMNPAHHTQIKKLYAGWTLENGLLSTNDVAFTTTANRIAFDGAIDFARDSIPGITIAVVDKNGCSLMDQKLYGKTNALKTGKLNITKTLLGSVINFVNAVVGKDCSPVYTGSVKAPVE